MRFSPWSQHSALETSALITFLFPLFSCSHSTPTTGYGSGLSLGRRATSKEIICSWDRPQSALFRDTIFLDGGTLTWQITGEDGKTETNSKPRQQLYYLNLTSAFSLADDGKTAIQSTAKPDTNMGTNFKNGFMLANNYQFIIYGGYMEYLDKDPSVGPTWSLARDIVQNGETPLQNPPKYRTLTLEKVTRYIAAGGSVNVPSENKAYVFSGATGKDWGEFYTTAGAPENATATYNSTNLISVDMSTMGSEKWDNRTIPSGIPARKNAEVVWLPVGSQGTLVVIGGALNRDSVRFRTDITDEQKTMGQSFVDNVHLYDIANDKWYTQQTSGDKPPATSEFCTVYAPSQDGKSFQIYAYGGWEDFSSIPTNSNPPSANVYVLSLPAFKWIKVYEDKDSTHGRKGHRCHKVADNLMMVVGGAVVSNGICINEGVVRMFNMNTLKWEDKYDPAVHDAYKVPDVVYKAIGGTEKGGANATPSSWNSSEIQDLFGIKYTKTVKNYWPYPSVSSAATTLPTVSGSVVPQPGKSSDLLPSYVPPLLGAILGLLVLITILCAVLFCLRRKRAQRKRLQSDSAASTVRKNRQTWSWLLGVYGDEKRGHEWVDPTPSTEPPNPFDASAVASPMTEVQTDPIETAGRQLYEMPDTSVAQELYSGSVPQRRVTISEQVTEIREDPKNKKSPSNDLPRSDNAPSTSTTTTTTASTADQISSPNRDSSPTREEGGHSVLARLLEEDELHTPTSPRGGEYRDNP